MSNFNSIIKVKTDIQRVKLNLFLVQAKKTCKMNNFILLILLEISKS